MANSLLSSVGGWRKRLPACGFALAVSALSLQVQVSLTPWVGNRPVLLLFMLPIIFSSYIGGLGPGLLSTLLCAGGAYYFLLAKAHNLLLFQGSVDLWQWVMLMVNGGLVSLLIGAMHRSGRQQTETQAQLSHSISLLRATIEASSDGLLVVDTHGRVTAFNSRFLEIWNLPEEAAEQGDAQLFPKLAQGQLCEPEEFLRRVQEHYAQPQMISFDTLNLKDGRVFERVSHPQRLGEIIVGRVWSFRDVTERKRTEKAVLEREQLLRQLVDLMPDFIFVKDPESRFLVVNESLAKSYGQSPAAMLHRTDADFLPAKLAAGFRASELRVMAADSFLPLEDTVTFPDGKTRTVVTNMVAFRDAQGKLLGVVGIGRDVTERKLAEEKFTREQARFKLVFDTIPIGIAFHTAHPDGSYTRIINDAHLRICGMTRDQHDEPGIYARLTHPDDRAPQRRLQEQVTAGLRKKFSLEKRYVHPDGKVVWVNFSYQRENYPDGIVEELTTVVDITERKIDLTRQQMLEEQLRQAQKMEAIGQLAGGVAHDFNNILAVIQMQAELFKMDAEASAEQAACLQEILTAANRGANLTRQLLLFSRRQRLQPRELDLSDSITSMTKMLRRVLGEDIQIQFKYAPQPLIIHADAGMMDQVLMNLTLNSRDAMPAGGQLVIETAAVEMDELAVLQSAQARPGSFARLSVSDTGCGIPPELLPRIFEPFFTTKDVGKGTGLGLATVFSIVQQHQGWINVVSEPGRGTTFNLYLPRLARSSAAAEPATNRAAVTGGSETILLVEDDDALRGSVRRCLSQLGYRLLEAASGAAALETWQQHRDEIHLLLTDLIMPGGMTGRELGERLQRENPKLAVVYVSGYSADIFTKDCPAGPGVTFLAKPFPAQTLALTIRARLDGQPNE